MVRKKTTVKPPETAVRKTVKKADYDDALRLAKELLDKINGKATWTLTDEKKLVKLTKIVAILSKLKPLKKGRAAPVVIFDSAKDAEIIKRFLERNNAGISRDIKE